MKKRILVLMALMMVMLAMSVAPAFARWETEGISAGCRTLGQVTFADGGLEAKDRNNNGLVCVWLHNGAHFYDDRLQT
jgi:hypothetical protein